MTREIEVQEGITVKFKASAALPRIYRALCGRDLFKDMSSLESLGQGEGNKAADGILDSLSMFEDLAYVMARHADPELKEPIEEWLGQFDIGAIIGIIPDLMDMWHINQRTTAESKKNYAPALVK